MCGLRPEGIVEDVDLIDAGVIFGTGFAPFRGGPLNYARTRALTHAWLACASWNFATVRASRRPRLGRRLRARPNA